MDEYDDEQNEDEEEEKIEDEDIEEEKTTSDTISKEKDNTLSPSSSMTSGTDVYMDAVDILSDHNDDNKSGRLIRLLD